MVIKCKAWKMSHLLCILLIRFITISEYCSDETSNLNLFKSKMTQVLKPTFENWLTWTIQGGIKSLYLDIVFQMQTLLFPKNNTQNIFFIDFMCLTVCRNTIVSLGVYDPVAHSNLIFMRMSNACELIWSIFGIQLFKQSVRTISTASVDMSM